LGLIALLFGRHLRFLGDGHGPGDLRLGVGDCPLAAARRPGSRCPATSSRPRTASIRDRARPALRRISAATRDAWARTFRVGFISSSTTSLQSPLIQALREGLGARGYEEGGNLASGIARVRYAMSRSEDC